MRMAAGPAWPPPIKIKGLRPTCTRGWQTRHGTTLSAPIGAAHRAQRQQRRHPPNRGRAERRPPRGIHRAHLGPSHLQRHRDRHDSSLVTCCGQSFEYFFVLNEDYCTEDSKRS